MSLERLSTVPSSKELIESQRTERKQQIHDKLEGIMLMEHASAKKLPKLTEESESEMSFDEVLA